MGEIVQPPAPADQIRFLTNVQRLLAEGLFTATYKYALIAALADLSNWVMIRQPDGRYGCCYSLALLRTTTAQWRCCLWASRNRDQP